MRLSRADVSRGVAAFLAAALVACGGGGSSTPTPVTTPTPAPTPLPPQVVAQRGGYSLEAGWIAWLPFPTSRAGALEATVDWTYATNDIDVALVKGECNYDQLVAGQCETLASSESTTAKPEKCRVANAPPATYTIFLYNDGPGDESISFQVVLSASVAAAAAGGTPSTGPFRQGVRPKGAVRIP